jgi:hypothetical protein
VRLSSTAIFAFRDLFRTKADKADRLDLEPRPLLFGGLESPARLFRRRAGCVLPEDGLDGQQS